MPEVTYTFVPGLKLNYEFHKQVVGPLLKREFPKLKYAAALTGNGSDVLGLDDAKSMDHNWGPSMRLFLPEKDYDIMREKVDNVLRKKLPVEFMGFPTNFSEESSGYLKQQMVPIKEGPVNHTIHIYTVRSFFEYFLGFNPYEKPTIEDWLTFPEQALLEVTGGQVYHDGLDLTRMRKKFSYYPKDVWLYIVMIQWGRIMNELQYFARTSEMGDRIGANILRARMIRRVMKMAFLLERQYSPYSKWMGRTFDRLPIAKDLKPVLEQLIDERDWRKGQRLIAETHQILAKKFNKLRLTKPVPLQVHDFHGRGYQVVELTPFYEAARRLINSKQLKQMRFNLGAVDQFIDHARVNHENYVYRQLKCVIK